MSASPDFAAHLALDVTTLCHGWRLTRRDGTVLGFTDHDLALAFGGTSFKPETGFTSSEARASLGLSVDTVDVEGALSSLDIREEDISAGLYDGATVETFLVNWRAPEQHDLLRTATLGKITCGDGRFVAELESLAHKLDQPSGRFIRRKCDAELGDGRCRFPLNTAAGFGGTGTIVAATAPGTFRVAGLDGFAAGWLSHGVLAWTGGSLSGRTARVRDHRVSAFGVELVLEDDGGTAPAAGDAFSVKAGCDKSFAACKAKFANPLNFRGFPHLPGNDAAYAYASKDQVFDGGALVP